VVKHLGNILKHIDCNGMMEPETNVPANYCEMRLRFPISKLLDYTWEMLASSDSPFALVVMAHRKTQDTTQSAPERLKWKLRLIKGLY